MCCYVLGVLEGTGGESIFPIVMAGCSGVERFRWPSRGAVGLNLYARVAVGASTEVE